MQRGFQTQSALREALAQKRSDSAALGERSPAASYIDRIYQGKAVDRSSAAQLARFLDTTVEALQQAPKWEEFLHRYWVPEPAIVVRLHTELQDKLQDRASGLRLGRLPDVTPQGQATLYRDDRYRYLINIALAGCHVVLIERDRASANVLGGSRDTRRSLVMPSGTALTVPRAFANEDYYTVDSDFSAFGPMWLDVLACQQPAPLKLFDGRTSLSLAELDDLGQDLTRALGPKPSLMSASLPFVLSSAIRPARP